jgi:endoglucanase
MRRFLIQSYCLISIVAAGTASAAIGTHNYAEALQKSLYFYDAEKSGPGITGGRLQWRGNSEVADARIPLTTAMTNLSQAFIDKNRVFLDPDNDSCVDVHGGYHDAGDHVKFGLPQSYAASTLGWGMYEFKDAFVKINEYDHFMDILKWFSDYFLRCTFRNRNGEIIAFCYQVGEGSVDHNYWGPPELQSPKKFPRPAYFATSEKPASDQTAGAAAALALMYLNCKGSDSAYASRCLTGAADLYAFAKVNRGLGYSGGFYGSSADQDELSWAAIWLYTATGKQSYLDEIIGVDTAGKYTGWMGKIIASRADNWQNIWVHSWDVVWGGVFIRLAALTNNDLFDYIARWNLEYWSGIKHKDPNDNNYLPKTPAGYSFLTVWGSARYNSAAQLCALVYNKYKAMPDFADWALGQMDYLLGDNPLGRSYEVGFGASSVKHPHHRAAHGSTTNSMNDPVEHRHVLWGALAGGPGSKDEHNDITSDYVYNEVAIDYNAGFVGALAGLYLLYGKDRNPLVSFPPQEPADTPYYAESKLEQENKERTQVTITVHNAAVHPPHVETAMKVRYFFSIAELLAAGQSIKDVSLQVMYDEQKTSYEGPTTIRGPLVWNADKGIYYVEIDWSGYELFGKRDIQIALISSQDGTWKSHWDAANDWSRQGITAIAAVNPHIPVYLGDKLVFGQEPEGASTIVNRSILKKTQPEVRRIPGDRGRIDVSWQGRSFKVTMYSVNGKLLGGMNCREKGRIAIPSGIGGCLLVKMESGGTAVCQKILLP